MNKVAQVLLYGVFAVLVGYFSIAPAYRYADPALASIKLSLSHAADRVSKCVKLTLDEINARAPRGVSRFVAVRARLPLTFVADPDGDTGLCVTAEPAGLWCDGPASVYDTIEFYAGRHTITARRRDSARETGWDHEYTENVVLPPGRYFTIRFREETGGFAFR